MSDINSVLSNCALFDTIQEHEYNGLLSCTNSYTKNFKQGEYIFLAGDHINYVGILIIGALELIKEDYAGSRHIMDFLSPSDIFGEGIACTKQNISPVSVRAKQDSSILFIPFERILKTCGNSCGFHLQLIKNMMFLLGEKNYFMNRKMELLMLKSLREKLSTFLLNEAAKQGSTTFNIHLNRNELAEYLNVSRTSMCRELATMKDLGMIDYYKNSFKLLSVSLLKETLLK